MLAGRNSLLSISSSPALMKPTILSVLVAAVCACSLTACDTAVSEAAGPAAAQAQAARSSSGPISTLDIVGPFSVKRNTTGAWYASVDGQGPGEGVDGSGYQFTWRVDTDWPFDNNPDIFRDPWPEQQYGWWYGTGSGDVAETYFIEVRATNPSTGHSVVSPLQRIVVEQTGGSEGACVQTAGGHYVYPCVGSTTPGFGQG